MDELRQRFVAEARSFIGTPWKHQGRTKTGIDCVGLLVVAAERAGIATNIKLPPYRREPIGASLLEGFDQFCDEKPLTEARAGDILITRDDTVAMPCHCGVIDERFGELRFIHAYARARRVVESRFIDFKNVAIRLYEIRK